MTAKATGQFQLKARAVYCAVESLLSALISRGRWQKCDESLTGAGQWCAAKLHTHCWSLVKTPYTLEQTKTC
jgi:hypothetical protein